MSIMKIRDGNGNFQPVKPVLGVNGSDGADGISPVVTLIREEDGVSISVTDAEGTKSSKVYDGRDGLENAEEALNFITPQQYGAVCDGITDDTAAFNAAIHDALHSGTTLYVPAGTYKVTTIGWDDSYAGDDSTLILGSKTDKTLIIEGQGQSTIIRADTFKLAGKVHPKVSNLQFKFTGNGEGISFGSHATNDYCNRGCFTNVYIYGEPVAMTFYFANAISFYDCRIASNASWNAILGDVKPVVYFASADQPLNNLMFFRCHFEETKENGCFLYRPSCKQISDASKDGVADTNFGFYGCHFETRNLSSRFFHLWKCTDIIFDGCAFTSNTYGGAKPEADTHVQPNSYLYDCANISFNNSMLDYWKTDDARFMDAYWTNNLCLTGRLAALPSSVTNLTLDMLIPTRTNCDVDTWEIAVTRGNSIKLIKPLGDNTLASAILSGAAGHNAYYRGKSLGTSVTDTQWAAISAGTFDDMFIGDYWTINGMNYRIAAFDYYFNTGNSNIVTQHHVTLVPDISLCNAEMYSENSALAYTETDMYKAGGGLDTATTTIKAAFGEHILAHDQYLCTAENAGVETAKSWIEGREVDLMTEQNVFGSRCYSNVRENDEYVADHGTLDHQQFPLFAMNKALISNRKTFWLRNVAHPAKYACVMSTGICHALNAGDAIGVRPSFSIVASST